MELHIEDRAIDIEMVNKQGNKIEFLIDGKPYEVDFLMAENGSCSIIHNGNSYNAGLIKHDNGKAFDIDIFYRSYRVRICDTQVKYMRMKSNLAESQNDAIVAPMPGKVVRIPVKKGDRLTAGDIAIVLEAMKMQSNYKVGADCIVKEIRVITGDIVTTNQTLIDLEIVK